MKSFQNSRLMLLLQSGSLVFLSVFQIFRYLSVRGVKNRQTLG